MQNYTCVVGSEASGGSLSSPENIADVDDAVEAGGAESHLFICFATKTEAALYFVKFTLVYKDFTAVTEALVGRLPV